MRTKLNRSLICGLGLVLSAGLSFAVMRGASPDPSRARATRQDECATLLDKIKAVERELADIQERKPPFDKMSKEEIADNIAYREKEVKRCKSRRYALGCPGAEAVVFSEAAETGGGIVAGEPPTSLEGAGLTLKEYAASIPSAYYREGDPCTCNLPGKDLILHVSSPSNARFSPATAAQGEFTSEVRVNGMNATAGSIGEDMQGYWGAAVSWTLNGLTYTVTMTVPYPEVKDDTPEKRKELYDQCLKQALEAAVPFDKAMRKTK